MTACWWGHDWGRWEQTQKRQATITVRLTGMETDVDVIDQQRQCGRCGLVQAKSEIIRPQLAR